MELELEQFIDKVSPYIIAGPCGAESEEQVLKSILPLANSSANLIRAGIWKPRTRPNSFEGVGKVGLPWLKNAGKQINKPVCVEVANANHVQEALKAEIDVLWIGARTSVNPFLVQEIADSLKGVDIPVMVKNPVNPDLALWLGALERFNRSGITKLAAIHRGFSTYEQIIYRNKPYWQIAIDLKRIHPELPLICDPSHMGGKRDLLLPISQKAIDLGYNGLMIECHCSPDDALSDAKQQVTPVKLLEILNQLSYKSTYAENPVFNDQLEAIRNEIDEIDEQLIEVIAKRMQLVKEIGKCKNEHNITIYQPQRWNHILNTRISLGATNYLSEEFITDLYKAIHHASINEQANVIAKNNQSNGSD